MPFKKIRPKSYHADSPLLVMGTASHRELGEKFSILVWNIYKAKKPGWKENFQQLVADKDLVLLQESVFNTPHNDIFETSIRFEWIMARGHQYHHDQMTTGLKTGAVASPVTQKYIHSMDREPLANTVKLALSTEYRLKNSDQILLVINVHAINFVSIRKYKRYINQTMSLIQHHVGSVIVAGDFNCWNRARAEFLFDSMKNEGLNAAISERKPLWRHLNRHIDHIFYRDLQLIKTESLSNINSSDHYPLMAEFSTK